MSWKGESRGYWVRAATPTQLPAPASYFGGYVWWIDMERPGRFYAMGKYGQRLETPDASRRRRDQPIEEPGVARAGRRYA
jgi:hypothetical protein